MKNMKIKIVVSLFIMLFNTMSSLSQELSKSVRNDFCKNALFTYWYGSDTFKTVMIFAARNNGADNIQKIEIQIEDLCNNISLQEEFFKLVNSNGGDSDYIFLQFHSIGMTAKNAKILSDYVENKYRVEINENIIEEKVEIKEDIKVTSAINKKPEYIGGNDKMTEYISSNIYKKLIKKYKKEKSVKQFKTIVEFTVNEDGSVSVNNIKDIDSSELEAEIKVAFESMPKWKCGGLLLDDGKFKPQKTKLTLPLTF